MAKFVCLLFVFGFISHETSGSVIQMHRKNDVCDLPSENARFDCAPEKGITSDKCNARGCCWKTASSNDISVPYCFFPNSYSGYKVSDLVGTDYGFTAKLSLGRSSGWPNDIADLKLDIFLYKMYLRFKIYDAKTQRYEVPIETPPPPTEKPTSTDYKLEIIESPFALRITRKSNGAILFDSSVAPIIFADQFIQISTRLDSGNLYGLGEHKDRLLHKADKWSQRSFFAHDAGPSFNANLYGVHPFYLEFENSGGAHGVFLLNSNAMEVDMQPLPALTFRTIGGIIDLSIFVGPSPDDVVQQYTSMIGLPTMPPYWALGFHLCRYGYANSSEVKKVIARNRAIGIPYDVQWTDIDYMDRFLDWTYDNNKFLGLPDIVKDLHDNDMKYVIIVDPGISSKQPAGTYPPYDDGIKQDIFIKNATGDVLIGKVWPGETAFPDFSNPASHDWWYDQANRFHKELPFDGLWTDMNEPSNFVTGSMEGCTNSSLDNPPYSPNVVGGSLIKNTICMSAQQHLSSHYNLHNLFGHFEVVATHKALEKILGKRSIVISRSTFPSTGRYGGHWSGDITSSWEDLKYSIPSILNFQQFGIPMVGADICGFGGKTTEQLCIRWMQLGAFYPFMRNHNALGDPEKNAPGGAVYLKISRWRMVACKDCKDQDPAVFSKGAQDIMRNALYLRYSMLPYLYSMLYATHLTGRPHAVRPLAFQYPNDNETYAIDDQFLWGSSFLVSPSLYQDQINLRAYFPADLWYDAYTGESFTGPVWKQLDTPLELTNMHVRGGSIVVQQGPGLTTAASRKNPFSVMVALDGDGNARSDVPLYWDDGETIDAFKQKMVTTVWFEASKNEVQSLPHVNYRLDEAMVCNSVRIIGVKTKPTSVTFNGAKAAFQYYTVGELNVYMSGDLTKPFSVKWE